MEELYRTLGNDKSREVFRKYMTLSNLYEMAKRGTRNPQIAGKVYEGIAKDFIREFLPPGFRVKSGLIFDVDKRKLSPEIDAIIYRGVPFLEFTDAVIVEQEQVEAILEIKSSIGTNDIFEDEELLKASEDRRRFIQATAKYILFAFASESSRQDDEVDNRLRQISNMYVIVGKKKIGQSWKSDANLEFNFKESVSGLIKYLRNLS